MKDHLYALGSKFAAGVSITPNTSLPGTSELETIVGGFITIVEILLVASMVAAALAWAWGSHSGNYQVSSRGRTALLIVLFAAIVVASANGLVNWALGANLGIA